MTYYLEKSSKGVKQKHVSVKSYKKKPGGYMGGVSKEYANAEFAKLKKNPSYLSEIKTHTRKMPTPTAQELKQKKLNNKLAAEGKKYRVEVASNGKTKKVSLDTRKNHQHKKRLAEFKAKDKKHKNTYSHETGNTSGAAYQYKRK